MLKRAALVAIFACACHNGSDLDFEIVKVPLVAYADAGPRRDASSDARADGGHELVVTCMTPHDDDDGDKEKSSDTNEDDCPKTWEGRNFDERATDRHRRSGGDEANVCCYRRGRVTSRPPVDEE